MLILHNYPQVIIIVEVSEYAPAYLNLQHIYTFFLEGQETRQLNIIMIINLQLPNNNLFNGLQVLNIELTLKNPLLKIINFRIINLPI